MRSSHIARLGTTMVWSVADERAFIERLRAMPAKRRQEWLRALVRIGTEGQGAVTADGETVALADPARNAARESETGVSAETVQFHVCLDRRIGPERKIIEAHQRLARSRRSEWLRRMLLRGAALEESRSRPGPAAALPEGALVARRAKAPEAVKPEAPRPAAMLRGLMGGGPGAGAVAIAESTPGSG